MLLEAILKSIATLDTIIQEAMIAPTLGQTRTYLGVRSTEAKRIRLSEVRKRRSESFIPFDEVRHDTRHSGERPPDRFLS